MSNTISFGGKAASRFSFACGLIFCRQTLEQFGSTLDVVAVWRQKDPDDTSTDNPTYVMSVRLSKQIETTIGCAVLCLEHLGIARPRTGTIMRVAGMLTEMSAPDGKC